MCALKVGVIGGAALEKRLRDLQSKRPGYVRAGFLENATYPDGTPVALVAGAQEFGVHADPELRGQDNDMGEDGSRPPGIPAKHFMRDTEKERKSVWAHTLGKALVEEGFDPEKALGTTGTLMRDDIQTAILTIEEPDVSERTKKRKNGRGKLLIETRVLLRAADYEVVGGKIEE